MIEENRGWHLTKWAWFWLIFFWPVGLYAFWKRGGKGQWWAKIFLGYLVVCIIVGLLVSLFSNPKSNTSTLDLSWSEDFNMQLSQAIVRQGISGCGQYEWAKSSNNKYVVRCTNDGHKWIKHTVFTD